jgi:hypothetical protein
VLLLSIGGLWIGWLWLGGCGSAVVVVVVE